MIVSNIVLFVIGLLALTVIVVLHELGHFIAAKKSGVLVEEFGVGLPPRIWGKKIGETLYSINLLPFGGFVRLHGETMDEKPIHPERAFSNAPAWKRIVVALAGIFMNFVLALVCFTIVYSITGIEKVTETDKVIISDVVVGTPAQAAGVIVGDIVTKVNKDEVHSSQAFIDLVNQNKGKKINLEIIRKLDETTETKVISLTPRENPPENQGALGVAITSSVVETYYPPLWQRPIVGFQEGLKQTIEFTKAVLGGFAQISKDVGAGRSPEGMVGFTGILAIFAYVIKQGVPALFNFMGIVSLNLAIFNLIPFPPLDGSRVLFVIIEKIFGKKHLPKIEVYAHSAGMIVLLALMIIITGREIPRLISAGSLSNFVEGLAK